MSKYAQLHAILGGPQAYNDKVRNGRVLKWRSDQMGQTLAERKMQAGKLLERLLKEGVYYVQKVEVRNAKIHAYDSFAQIGYTYDDMDKICVYVDAI